ncbi:MAG: omptin family outer membrane protease, partial [bacterium]
MKHLLLSTVILAAGLLASSCCATEDSHANESAPCCSIAGSVAHLQGSLGFELGNDEFGAWSKLKWPLDGMLGGIEGAVTWPLDAGCAILVSARYGRSLSLGGTGKDWDWRPWEQPGMSDYSETDSSGTLQTLDLRAGFRLPAVDGVNLQLIAGYSRSSVDFDDEDLTGSYDYGQTPIEYPGLAATYSAAFSGFCLGGEVMARASDKLTLSARLEAMVNLSVSADGDWVRRGNSFSQNARGMGLTLAGKAGYEIRNNVTLTAQVEWISRSAEDGQQSGTQELIRNRFSQRVATACRDRH